MSPTRRTPTFRLTSAPSLYPGNRFSRAGLSASRRTLPGHAKVSWAAQMRAVSAGCIDLLPQAARSATPWPQSALGRIFGRRDQRYIPHGPAIQPTKRVRTREEDRPALRQCLVRRTVFRHENRDGRARKGRRQCSPERARVGQIVGRLVGGGIDQQWYTRMIAPVHPDILDPGPTLCWRQLCVQFQEQNSRGSQKFKREAHSPARVIRSCHFGQDWRRHHHAVESDEPRVFGPYPAFDPLFLRTP